MSLPVNRQFLMQDGSVQVLVQLPTVAHASSQSFVHSVSSHEPAPLHVRLQLLPGHASSHEPWP